jgi:hypothetical protein
MIYESTVPSFSLVPKEAEKVFASWHIKAMYLPSKLCVSLLFHECIIVKSFEADLLTEVQP